MNYNLGDLILKLDNAITEHGGKMFVGGSYAVSKVFKNVQWRDIDIFVLGPRTYNITNQDNLAVSPVSNFGWDFKRKLASIGTIYESDHQDEADDFKFDDYYRIENQYKRIKVTSSDIRVAIKTPVPDITSPHIPIAPQTFKSEMLEIDLIFVDDSIGNLINDSSGSDLARIYYEIYKGALRIVPESSQHVHNLLGRRHCNVFPDKCTETQLFKVRERCEELGLRTTDKFDGITADGNTPWGQYLSGADISANVSESIFKQQYLGEWTEPIPEEHKVKMPKFRTSYDGPVLRDPNAIIKFDPIA